MMERLRCWFDKSGWSQIIVLIIIYMGGFFISLEVIEMLVGAFIR